jgi:hypothetical protein
MEIANKSLSKFSMKVIVLSSEAQALKFKTKFQLKFRKQRSKVSIKTTNYK